MIIEKRKRKEKPTGITLLISSIHDNLINHGIILIINLLSLLRLEALYNLLEDQFVHLTDVHISGMIVGDNLIGSITETDSKGLHCRKTNSHKQDGLGTFKFSLDGLPVSVVQSNGIGLRNNDVVVYTRNL